MRVYAKFSFFKKWRKDFFVDFKLDRAELKDVKKKNQPLNEENITEDMFDQAEENSSYLIFIEKP